MPGYISYSNVQKQFPSYKLPGTRTCYQEAQLKRPFIYIMQIVAPSILNLILEWDSTNWKVNI